MEQVFELQLAAALEVDTGAAAWAGNLQRRLGADAVTRIVSPMSHDLNELADVRQVMRQWRSGQHMRQIEFVSAKAELLSVRAPGLDHQGISRAAKRSGRARTRPRASGALQEPPRGSLIELTKQVALTEPQS